MSDEAFGILKRLNPNGLETQIALQCAPLLVGIKLSNLLIVETKKKAEVFRLFARSSISCFVLAETRQKTSILLYHEDSLKRWLARPEVKSLMDSFGYAELPLGQLLAKVAGRYQAHIDGRAGFPHEIGLLLGYPPEDVTGFIENGGKDFLYSGYWKVYGDVERSRRIFEGYDMAQEAVIRMAGSGSGIRDIMAACSMQRQKRTA